MIDRARASLQVRIGRTRARIDRSRAPGKAGLTDRELRRDLNAAEHAELARLYHDATISQAPRQQLQHGLDLEAARPERWQVWAGQYAGIAVLAAVSVAAGPGLTLLPERWIWLPGLPPLGLGAGKPIIAIRTRRRGGQAAVPAASSLPGVAGITIANGGDNLAACTPVFATAGAAAAAVTAVVFTAGTAVWCLAGWRLVTHHRVTDAVRRWGHRIIPAVYILIGLYIFQKAGALGRAF